MIDYHNLTEIQQCDLIDNSINLMRNIVEIAGEDAGTAMWDKICETMGPEVKGAILFSMLTGDNLGSTIRITSLGTQGKFVEIIKAVRTGTGMGLKEAKDAYDKAKTTEATLRVLPKMRHVTAQALRNLGCTVK